MFWQRDSLAVPLFTREVAMQKLDYIHDNPLQERWNLAKHPCDYKYSSAKYYECNEKNFSFLKDLLLEIKQVLNLVRETRTMAKGMIYRWKGSLLPLATNCPFQLSIIVHHKIRRIKVQTLLWLPRVQ